MYTYLNADGRHDLLETQEITAVDSDQAPKNRSFTEDSEISKRIATYDTKNNNDADMDQMSYLRT